ncbi:MAG: hypothetical protein A2X80_10045 [Geobacteraceae bacterium GWB2_52_12]|nr:MAG: hypothetical protein A2X80_10045 [Geobacteraceae bacterium GWB2_52_12]
MTGKPQAKVIPITAAMHERTFVPQGSRGTCLIIQMNVGKFLRSEGGGTKKRSVMEKAMVKITRCDVEDCSYNKSH